MKKLIKALLIKAIVLCIVFNIAKPTEVKAMDAKVKAFLILSVYGAAGGGLLGLASMAFGEESIAIARGASLGLYAGMIFGGYVIMSHKYKKKPGEELPPADTYQDPVSPYSETEGQEDGGYDGFFSAPQLRMQMDEFNQRRMDMYESSLINKKGRPDSPPIYFHLIQYNF